MATNDPTVTTPSPPLRAAQAGWARLFGYDVFLSFALGPPPLRERGFRVFFSEDEAPVGAELGGTLRRALSRRLVVVANCRTLV